MHGHATINRLYRLVWSDTLGTWVAVAETTRGRGKRSGRGKLLAALFAGLATGGLAQAAAPPPNQLPTGGQVTGGQVGIGQQGATMTVTQGSQRGAIDWQTFNVGSQAQVNFVQPSSSAVTLNRVLDTQASQIYGRISANGQIFLSNPNGVYFSAGASVDVGGLVATTHGIDSADFMAGGTTFKRDGATGSVVNDGRLNAALGGYIALLAPEVRNNGIVVAQAGTVALAGGEAISLQFDARQWPRRRRSTCWSKTATRCGHRAAPSSCRPRRPGSCRMGWCATAAPWKPAACPPGAAASSSTAQAWSRTAAAWPPRTAAASRPAPSAC